jgi:hypothetical protein
VWASAKVQSMSSDGIWSNVYWRVWMKAHNYLMPPRRVQSMSSEKLASGRTCIKGVWMKAYILCRRIANLFGPKTHMIVTHYHLAGNFNSACIPATNMCHRHVGVSCIHSCTCMVFKIK